ncbi:MAG: glycoside hydrolase family 9 protein [Actinomycetota bacterium]|nr:glycoside hydrolase family 9 protein [Actinomycetota bacterium]
MIAPRQPLACLAAVGFGLVAAALAMVVAARASTRAPIASRPASSGATTAFVRVDQLGYPSPAAKRAYLISSAPENGAAYTVRTGAGATVFMAAVGRSAGAWSPRFPYVYVLDFDPVVSPGEYLLAVSGPVPASSPPFSIGSAASIYAGPLRNALSYYRNQRDGPHFIRSALRAAPAHLNDEHARTYLTPTVDQNGAFKRNLVKLPSFIDAAGGWWDAGDYLKFVQTTGYTVPLMLIGVRDFPAQMGASAGRSNFTAEARFGVRWLLRMWNDRTRTLYYQVGIGNGNSSTFSDHDVWRVPQADDHYGGHDRRYRYIRHRPVFRAGPPGSLVSPNLAGRDAAAFALCFQAFRHSDPRLAARCLQAGEHIFALADTHPRGPLLTVIPFGFYPETQWRDDLELGAVELANALLSRDLPAGLPHSRARYYLRQAAHWARAYIGAGGADTLNLYDVSGLAHYELYRVIGRLGDPPGLEVTRLGLLAALRKELDRAVSIAQHDPFGFGFPWSVEDTGSHGFGLSVMASEYATATGSRKFRSWSIRWLGNVLGANAWGASTVIGDGTTFPHCPQHQVANLVGSLDGSGPVLAGAVVEGPSGNATTGVLTHMRACPPDGGDRYALFNGRAVFRDNVQSYSTVEPAIDLAASSPLAFAWQISLPRPLRAG